jgi:hypothetical protein
MKEIKSYKYTLWTMRNEWLGTIVLTECGMFAAVTDYGDFVYRWKCDDIKKFILQMKVCYLATSIKKSMSYVSSHKSTRESIDRFAKNILPSLQDALSKEKQIQ